MIGRGRVIFIIFLLSLSGCSFGKQDEPVTLTINYLLNNNFTKCMLMILRKSTHILL